MYLWNVKALAGDLKADKVSQKDKMKYYLLVTVLLTTGFFSPPITFVTCIRELIVIVITCIGIFLCYEANRFGDNKNFIDRMICLAVPLNIRIAVITIVVAVGLMLIYPPQKDEFMFDLLSVPAICIIECFYYAVLRSYILDISGANRENNTTAPPTA